ncbi:hypothetical protein [uncultured Aquabacterium sp.]|uniref:hypothetical protein n=1 Tax=uncultured Aquabacterium sp. TaxID=158753 RepID=UPI0025F6EBAD|nr:hypothetical protein [uncultured Aquabacterium sp.]
MRKLIEWAKPEGQFTEDERKLYDLMSDISEDCWCAGWMCGNEYAIWDALKTGDRQYGMMEMDSDLLAEVARLSAKTGGWIVWIDAEDGIPAERIDEWGPYFIPLHPWLKEYGEHMEEKGADMTPIEKLRSLARMIPLDCWSSAITEVEDEMEREAGDPLMVAHSLRRISKERANEFNDTFYLGYVADMLEQCPKCRGSSLDDEFQACTTCAGTGKRMPHAPKGAE